MGVQCEGGPAASPGGAGAAPGPSADTRAGAARAASAGRAEVSDCGAASGGRAEGAQAAGGNTAAMESGGGAVEAEGGAGAGARAAGAGRMSGRKSARGSAAGALEVSSPDEKREGEGQRCADGSGWRVTRRRCTGLPVTDGSWGMFQGRNCPQVQGGGGGARGQFRKGKFRHLQEPRSSLLFSGRLWMVAPTETAWNPSGCGTDCRLIYRWTGGAHRSGQ